MFCLTTSHTEKFYFVGIQIYIEVLKLVVCILLRVLGQVQGFRLMQHCFEYFVQ
jgi:hypothetical protein